MDSRTFHVRSHGAAQLLAGLVLLIVSAFLIVLGLLGLLVGARNIEYVLGLALVSLLGGSRLVFSGGRNVFTGRK